MNERILIIEDDQDIAFIEKDYLEMSGYAITIASDGLTGLKEGLSGSYQLVLLDVMLPGMDGFEVCRRLRDKVDIPIMMVTAKREDIDKIRGLGFGADDYVEKPFSPSVLVARVKSQLAQYQRLKGTQIHKKSRITLGNISLDPDTHRVFVGDKEKSCPIRSSRYWNFSWSMPTWSSAKKRFTTKYGAWIPWGIRRLCRSISTGSVKPSKKTPINPAISLPSGGLAISLSHNVH